MRPLAAECLPPSWAASRFPAGLPAAQGLIAAGLLDRVGEDGAVRDGCRSRVLESALTLALLERHGHGHAGARARLTRYLECHRGGGLLDGVFAEAALGQRERPLRPEVFDAVRDRVPDFAGARKRALVHALLTMLGAAPGREDGEPAAFALASLHPWAAVQVTAVKVVLGRAAGKPPAAAELALLASTQRRGIVWEGNLLIHLSVLHALAGLPGMGATVEDGLRTALLHQREDGGMPFVTDTDTWSTVTAGLALHTAGAPRRILHHVARHLVTVQQEDGGWSYTDRARLSDTDCTSVAVEFLHQLDPRAYRDAIRRGTDALIAVRGPDGGFPTYGAGTPSEACMTAAAVNALSTMERPPDAVVRSALHHLVNSRRQDGTFPPGWSSSRLHTFFRVHLAIGHSGRQATPAVRVMHERITSLVCADQRADGGFGQQDGSRSDAISTAYGLIVLAGRPDPAPAARAARHLLSHVRPDGSVDSPPDMVGPRPFPYHVPVLAGAFALLALGHLTSRIRPVRPLAPALAQRTRAGAERTLERTLP
ncbi:prenyltransferase/squalene oxidase repeat-containing protein [Actinacidiphila paucisporea]|uniref:Squalene-hopene/tetraprenyl-beta-curcumene cyclase/sporulenol synthase n=1 Tax=Actinacidiphila paucisporea TaxID=310782 RepID=A0A1M7IA92_9ACTN|nr:prenyltransferase/squalene oxidase repeat-containing protein [Actinacidiphila paucisporea]SHM37387.1 squalene-hopene/tetraprenyl-beta-curcumene cyclase/sporulenol synthase [Actinacidiphila paucisporea]